MQSSVLQGSDHSCGRPPQVSCNTNRLRSRFLVLESKSSAENRSQRQWRLRAEERSESGLPLPDLRDRLDFAIRAEDYEAAASLRDELQRRQSDVRLAVEEVNRRFYAAFEAGDIKAMDALWGHGDHIQVLHPATQCIAGREGVIESWRLILRNTRGIKIGLEDVRIYAGDSDAFLTCVEVIDANEERGRTAATNIFERQDGRWVLVHHQGGPIPSSGKGTFA